MLDVLVLCRDGILRSRATVRNRATGRAFHLLLPAAALDEASPGWMAANARAEVDLEPSVTAGEILACLAPFSAALVALGGDLAGKAALARETMSAFDEEAGRIEIHCSVRILGVPDRMRGEGIPFRRERGSRIYRMDSGDPIPSGRREAVFGWAADTLGTDGARRPVDGCPPWMVAALPVSVSRRLSLSEDGLSAATPGGPLLAHGAREGGAAGYVDAPAPCLDGAILSGLVDRLGTGLATIDDEGDFVAVGEADLAAAMARSAGEDSVRRAEEESAGAAGPEAEDALEARIIAEIVAETAARRRRDAADPWSPGDLRLLRAVGLLSPAHAAAVRYPRGRPE